MHTLISFLGNSKNYEDTTYQFKYKEENNKETILDKKTNYFGIALSQFINEKAEKIEKEELKLNKILLIGTSTSSWELFFLKGKTKELDKKIEEELKDARERNDVKTFLEKNTITIQEKFNTKCNIEYIIIIDYAKTTENQIGLLQQIADKLKTDNENEDNEEHTISLDITFSFRHLPMLSLVISRFLKHVKNIRTDQIYYGANDMKENRGDKEREYTPVIELGGILKMLDWVDALSVYNHSGNYRVFSELFEQEGEQKQAEHLKEATFFENTNQTEQAHYTLNTYIQQPMLNNSPMIQLFKNELNARISKVNDPDLYTRQINLAEFHLNKKDYLRASLFGIEAWITKIVRKYYTNNTETKYQLETEYNNREEAKKNFRKAKGNFSNDKQKQNIRDDFETLHKIRNICAHASDGQKPNISPSLQNEQMLDNELKRIFTTIKNYK